MKETMFLDATAQAALIRSGEISPAEFVEQTIRRVEKLTPVLNAVVIPLFEKAHAEARMAPDGPCRGVPYLLKDLALVSKGDLTCQSIAGVKAAGYRAPPPARPFVAEVGAPAGRGSGSAYSLPTRQDVRRLTPIVRLELLRWLTHSRMSATT